MYAVALVDFHDNLKDVDRRKGEEFLVTKARYDEINSKAANFGLDAIVGESVRTAKAVKETPESRARKAR